MKSKKQSSNASEISGPVEFQIQQWFNLKKWKTAEYALFEGENVFLMTYEEFFSITEKLHVCLQLGCSKEENDREYKIEGYRTFISSDSLGGISGDRKHKTPDVVARSAMLQSGADPTQFEYWLTYESEIGRRKRSEQLAKAKKSALHNHSLN